MILQNLTRRFNGKKIKGKLFHQLKQTKGFSLHGLPTVRFQHRTLWTREPLSWMVGGIKCVEGNEFWEREGQVRVYLEMLWNLYATSSISLIIRKTLQVHGKCAPTLGQKWCTFTHTPCWVWSRIPGEAQSLFLQHRWGCTLARCESTTVNSKWELTKQRNSERLQIVVDQKQRPLKELREAQARHHKECDAKEVC